MRRALHPLRCSSSFGCTASNRFAISLLLNGRHRKHPQRTQRGITDVLLGPSSFLCGSHRRFLGIPPSLAARLGEHVADLAVVGLWPLSRSIAAICVACRVINDQGDSKCTSGGLERSCRFRPSEAHLGGPPVIRTRLLSPGRNLLHPPAFCSTSALAHRALHHGSLASPRFCCQVAAPKSAGFHAAREDHDPVVGGTAFSSQGSLAIRAEASRWYFEKSPAPSPPGLGFQILQTRRCQAGGWKVQAT